MTPMMMTGAAWRPAASEARATTTTQACGGCVTTTMAPVPRAWCVRSTNTRRGTFGAKGVTMGANRARHGWVRGGGCARVGAATAAAAGDDGVGTAAAGAEAAAKRERVVAAKWAGSAPELPTRSSGAVDGRAGSAMAEAGAARASEGAATANASKQIATMGETCPLGSGIWDKLREEAKADLEREPALASYLYSTILAHKKVEDVLAFVLANKLASTVLLDSQLLELFSAQYRKHKHLTRMMLADMQAVFERDPACDRYLAIVLFFKGFQAIQAQRVAHSLWLDDRKPLAFLLQNRISEVFHVDIHPGAVLGQGMMMDHATGVVIGETAVVGENVSILHGVTLGGTGTSKGDRHPKIGDGVVIGAGVTILGNIKVGKNSKIGAGSVVLEEIGEACTAVGIPAKVISRSPSETQPSLSMDQTSYMSDYFI